VSKKPNTMDRPRILLLDRLSPSLRSLAATLEAQGFAVTQTEEPEVALESIRAGECAVLLGEIHLAARAVLAEVQRPEALPPLIVFDDFAGSPGPGAALRASAFDTLARPVSDEDVLRSVRRALDSHTLRLENSRLKRELDEHGDFGPLSSTDPRMRRIFATLGAVADSRATLLIAGESGTGKTQLAHAVHAESARAGQPFVEVNCGALPSALLESELFGHVRGAFTGAVRDRVGKFEQAAGGTILLDEIGSATNELQLKLLRVLEEGRYERVGDTRTRTVDARVIAATNVDLEGEVAAGRFRADLYYRIHVVAIEVPPLRERVADVPLLARRFCARFARLHARDVRGLTPEALHSLCAHPWPGNVRELENALERAVLVARGVLLEARDLWPADRRASTPGTSLGFEGWQAGPPAGLKRALEGPERWLIQRALEQHGGNRSATARALGINRTTLFNKMRRYALLSFPVRAGEPPDSGERAA
jgi:DNA-binding NtrC family response regulator